MYCMALKVHLCESLNIFSNFYMEMNIPEPDLGSNSNIDSPYYSI
jgi:hypothetical protein